MRDAAVVAFVELLRHHASGVGSKSFGDIGSIPCLMSYMQRSHATRPVGARAMTLLRPPPERSCSQPRTSRYCGFDGAPQNEQGADVMQSTPYTRKLAPCCARGRQ